MAVARDATGTINNQADATGGAHTLPNASGLTVISNTNGAILYFAHIIDPTSTAPALTAVSGYTSIGTISAATQNANWVRMEIWGKVGNTTGAQTVTGITTNAGWTTSTETQGWLVSWTGVDQTGGATSFANVRTAQGATNNPSSGAITKNASADATVSGLAAGNDTPAVPNKTQLYLDSGNSPSSTAQFETGGASTQTHTWTYTVAGQWALVAFDLVAAGAAASKVAYQPYFQQMLASKRKPMVGWREGYDHRWRRWRRERGLIIPNKSIRRAA